ncbi:YcnI family protein [Streptomyces sp. NPDC001985]|uniref:YcnI family copper-binding membrane protein n=1 Tax=Streptomyces sp. NPDC001985 TaxID=3154406 RepID=UPI0033208D19
MSASNITNIFRTFPTSRFSRNALRVTVATGVAASAVLLVSGTAAAHVSVQPQGQATKGGYATVNFRVPNERDDASTVKLEISLPSEHPLTSALPQPVPGWKVSVAKAKLDKPLESHGKKITEVVSKITWTAESAKVAPGQFQQFPVALGRLPEDVDQLVFKALQTYDNKEIVRWIEAPEEGKEPELPAPVLALSEPVEDDHATQPGAGATATADAKNAGQEKETASASDDSSDSTARVLGGIGILVGAVGVAFGVLAGRRRAS